MAYHVKGDLLKASPRLFERNGQKHTMNIEHGTMTGSVELTQLAAVLSAAAPLVTS